MLVIHSSFCKQEMMSDINTDEALPDEDLFKDQHEVYEDIVAGVEQLNCLSNLDSLSRKCEERMKVVALRLLGSDDKVIDDVYTLEE